MSKKVTIPTDGGNPFVVILGGIKYVYKPGETVEVPDGVALEIKEWERWKNKYHGAVQPPFAAGGGGAQPDLSQNDPNAADYVKNRTHWVEDAVLFDGEVTTFDVGGMFGNPTDISISIDAGENYTVVFNGVTYECEAKISHEFGGMVYLGDPYFFTMTGTPAIPFAYADGIFATENEGIFAVTIKGKQYHPIKSAYLPDATEATRGAVKFGFGETNAARIVESYFNATKDDIERAFTLSRYSGVVLKIVESLACYNDGAMDGERGMRFKILSTEPSLVIAKVDENGNFTMDRECDTLNVVQSPSGKYFRITVDDNGSLSTKEFIFS